MQYLANIHPERKLNRLPDYDYSQTGWYFTTICVKNKLEFFGEIKDGEMILNKCGETVKTCWLEIPKHFPGARLDEFMAMPNHVHGIVIIDNDCNKNVGNKDFCSLHERYNCPVCFTENLCSLHECEIPWQTKWSKSLSSIIRGFKIGVTKWCRENGQENFQWQKSFYDHVIRNEQALNNIRAYIRNNPIKWFNDRNQQANLYY